MGDPNIQARILKRDIHGHFQDGFEYELSPNEPIPEISKLAASDAIDDPFPPPTVSENSSSTSRDHNTSSIFESMPPGDAMSDSSVPSRHAKQRRSQHSNPQRRSTPHSTQPPTTHSLSLPSSPQVPFENTQHRQPTNFSIPSLHFSSSPPPHTHGGVYIGQYTMSPQSTPMGAVHSPTPYGYSHAYHHPTVSDSSLISQNLHSHYQSLSQHPPPGPVYQTGPTPMYPSHQANALGQPTSPHSTSSPTQNSPLSPSYIGSGVFHSLQYPSPMSTPHYPYSPPFSGTPSYQSQYAPPQFSQHYTAGREGEPQGDWYYVPRRSPAAPSQQYEAGPSYSGHYSTTYPQMRPDLPYNPHSFSSAGSSTPYAAPPFSQHSEAQTTEIRRDSVVHPTSQSSSSEHLTSDKPIIRQPYHPNPPPHRSEWVMWAGNIPSDATHDEIYRFFSQAPEDQTSGSVLSLGVVSVFLISRSNCAFINFESENYLYEAISRFNGVPLRADDPRCARLVCRVRRKDDDLKAGVGGQRGTGMHTKWVKERKQKGQEKTKDDQSDLSVFDRGSTSPSSTSELAGHGISNFSSDNSEIEPNIHAKHSSTSDSHSSSNSSFLARHFPKRYFILKSLTQHDLDLSVETGFWATQKHNEGILDQSYRTSKDVYLIFGANKSGEFYGYARMAGPVRRGGQNISWAPSPPRSNHSTASSRLSSQSSDPAFFSPGDHRLVDNSPLSIENLHTKFSPDQQAAAHHQSAPSMFGMKYNLPSMKTPEMKYSLDQQRMRLKTKSLPSAEKDDFQLDPSAPIRAMKSAEGKSGSRRLSLHSVEEVEERAELTGDGVPIQGPTISQQQEPKGEEVTWGDCFAVQWISTEKVPFSRTRHLRNPWNHDREVKVSRDGTELEPTVGQRLLDEWHQLSEPQPLPLVDGVDGMDGHADPRSGLKSAGSSSKSLAPPSTPQRSVREGKEREKTG